MTHVDISSGVMIQRYAYAYVIWFGDLVNKKLILFILLLPDSTNPEEDNMLVFI